MPSRGIFADNSSKGTVIRMAGFLFDDLRRCVLQVLAPALQLIALATCPHEGPQDPFNICTVSHLQGSLSDFVRPHLKPRSYLC